MLDVIILPCWRVRYLVLKLPSSSIILKTLKDWEKLVSYTENRTCTHLMNLLRCRAILNLCNEPSERAYRRCWVEFGGGGLFWMRFLLRGHIGTVLLIATIVQFLLQHFDGVP